MKNILRTIAASLLICGVTLNATAQNKPEKSFQKDKMERLPSSNGDVEDIEGVENVKLVGISGWSAFNHLVKGMRVVEGMDYMSTEKVINSLIDHASQLMITRPAWMNTEEVNEDVRDFQKDFMEFVNEKSYSEKEYFENLEEIKEQFADLREEINETYVKYAKINREIYKETQAEQDVKTNRILNADAQEVYEDEVEDLRNLIDGEMTKEDKKAAKRKAKEMRKAARKVAKEERKLEKMNDNI